MFLISLFEILGGFLLNPETGFFSTIKKLISSR